MPSAQPLSLEEADELLCAAAGEALSLHHLDPLNSAEEMAKVAADPKYNPIFHYAEQNTAKLEGLRAQIMALDLPGFGVGLWVYALYVMAHLVAGLPAFLDFYPIAWASLGGHILFGLVVGAVVRWREARTAA